LECSPKSCQTIITTFFLLLETRIHSFVRQSIFGFRGARWNFRRHDEKLMINQFHWNCSVLWNVVNLRRATLSRSAISATPKLQRGDALGSLSAYGEKNDDFERLR
jgi:hypothetical protein